MGTVEAAYSLDGTDAEWLARVLDAMRPDLERGGGSYAFTCRIDRQKVEIGSAYVERGLDPEFASMVAELNRTAPDAFFDIIARNVVLCGAFLDVVGNRLQSHLHAVAGQSGTRDALALFAQDGEGHAINVTAPSSQRAYASPRVRGIWNRVGLHVSSAMRLRRRFAHARDAHNAVFAPSGALVHAEGALRDDRASRRVLGDAVRSMERARTTAERSDPVKALELWRGLVGGEWSLVDGWEKGGHRYVAAYKNAPHVHDPRALAPLERIVLKYASLCASNKEIAFALGLSESTVATAVSHVLRKLGCRRRTDLVVFADVERAEHARLPVGEGELGVLSWPSAISEDVAARLSPAEHDVAAELVKGKTNREIAELRGTSPNTVANQVRAMFEKLGLDSRSALVRALTRK